MYEVRTVHETVSIHDSPKAANVAAKVYYATHGQYVEIRNPRGERLYYYGRHPTYVENYGD